MSGFLEGKIIKSNSIDILDKLDERNYTTQISDDKSLVNVKALNEKISSSLSNYKGDVNNLKVVIEGKLLKFKNSSDGNRDITYVDLSVLNIPDNLEIEGNDLRLMSGSHIVDTVDLTNVIRNYLTNNAEYLCTIINNTCDKSVFKVLPSSGEDGMNYTFSCSENTKDISINSKGRDGDPANFSIYTEGSGFQVNHNSSGGITITFN